MIKQVNVLVFWGILTLLINCSSDTDTPNLPSGNDSWSIPQELVFDGGPGKDGIPAIEAPEFATTSATTYLQDDDLVLGIRQGNVIRGYSHVVLDYHEIVNDQIDDLNIAITYCPLTGTGIGWNRVINGNITTFGVSGLLYNSNLIPYDRETDSYWSQMRLDCVNGPRIGRQILTYQMIEMSWKTWKDLYPDSEVITTNTGFDRGYGVYPYGSYRTNESLLFPIENDDTRFPKKERVLGIIVEGEAIVYRFNSFPGDKITIDQRTFKNRDLVIAGSTDLNLLVAFRSRLSDGTRLTFTGKLGPNGQIMEDNEGNGWDAFGYAVAGPRTGEKLRPTKSYMGFWFAWTSFFPRLQLIE